MCAPPDSFPRNGVTVSGDEAGFVLLVEEKPICRLAITQVVGETVRLGRVRATSDLAEAAEILGERAPALLLVDLFSINYDFKGLRRLLAVAPQTPAVVVDDRVNPAFSQIAQDAGAHGYISKDFNLNQFKHALAAVYGGGSYFPARAPRRASRTGSGLSPRQMDVLKQMAVGRRNREIADLLGITPGTVKLHIHAILRLTGARNRTEAALLAGRFLAPTPDV